MNFNIQDFILGVFSSIVAQVVLFFILPSLTQTPLGKLWNFIYSAKIRFSEKSMNNAIKHAAEGRSDATIGAMFIVCFILLISLLGLALYFASDEIPKFGVIPREFTIEVLLSHILAFSLLILALIFLIPFTTLLIAMELFRMYNWRMSIIAPFMTVKEEKEVRALWALMKNKDDYQHFNEKLDSLAQMNGVVLPEPSLKVRV